ncbi:MAG: hypothetical protein WKG06_10820 [Segetibacter sp.]
METQEQVKDMVRQKYSEIALQDKETNAKLMLWFWLLLNRSV